MIPAVYYVSWPGEKNETLSHLAIRPRINESAKKIEWWDTDRGHGVHFTKILFDDKENKNLNSIPNKIEISTNDGTITLQFLTKQIFDIKVLNNIGHSDGLEVKDTQEVQDLFLRA